MVERSGIISPSLHYQEEEKGKESLLKSSLENIVIIVLALFFLFIHLYLDGLIFTEKCQKSIESKYWVLFGICLFIEFIPFLILSFLLTRPLFSSKNYREYHACEHKVACLLSRELPLTIENLRIMPRVGIECGTSYVVFVASFSFHAFFRIFFSFYIAFCFWLIVTLFSLWFFQFFFTTAEPSEEKLLETLGVIKSIQN